MSDTNEPSLASAGSARHSTGPWRRCMAREGGCQCGLVWSEADDVVVAKVPKAGDIEYEDAPAKEQAAANLSLVVAAPELLSMLKRIIRATDEGCDERACALIELARKAVSRAENG